MRVFRATDEFRQGNGPDNFRTQTSVRIMYGVPNGTEQIERRCCHNYYSKGCPDKPPNRFQIPDFGIVDVVRFKSNKYEAK